MKCFQVIDLLVKLLQCALKEGDEEPHMIRIFKEAYDVLHAYMIGKSRKNALYFAKYIDFFQTQFTQKVTQPERYPDKYYLIFPFIIYLEILAPSSLSFGDKLSPIKLSKKADCVKKCVRHYLEICKI